MNEFLAQALDHDASASPPQILRFLREGRSPAEISHQVYQLLSSRKFLEAHVTAGMFCDAGHDHPVLHFARCIGLYMFGNDEDTARCTARLSALVDRLSADQQRLLFQGIVQPVIEQVVMNEASLIHNHDRALRLLDVLRAGSLEFRTLFDWERAGPALDPAAMARQARARTALMDFPEPPPGTPRRRIRAVVGLREFVFPGQANSRAYDIGMRITAAMTEYGWDAEHFPMSFLDYPGDLSGILHACERARADVVFLDDYGVLSPQTHGLRASWIAALRQRLPGIRIVSIHLDPWAIAPEYLIATSAMLDAVWAPFPSVQAWRDPSLIDKMIFVPLPHAGQWRLPETPLSPTLTFAGGVFGYNWHRAFWLAGVRRGIPLVFQQSTHRSDGMSVFDSYVAYITRLEASGCSVNFSMRPNLSRILTGRFFETVLAGALLIQEETPEMDHYLVAGEHFLAFRTVSELRAIVRFIAEQPEQAEAIRRQGNAFARARYNDEALIASLDAHLFHTPGAQAGRQSARLLDAVPS